MKNNKKGFTIVELVIVIAVIAILAGVLIPTFASIVKKANDSEKLQQVSAARSVIISEENGQLATSEVAVYYFIYLDGADTKWFELRDGEMKEYNTPSTVVVDGNDVLFAHSASVLSAQSVLTPATDDPNTTEVEPATKLVYNTDLSEDVIVFKQVIG